MGNQKNWDKLLVCLYIKTVGKTKTLIIYPQNQLITKMKHTTIILLAIIILALTTTQALSLDDPVANAKRITACILKLVEAIAPYMMLALIIIGGITYLTAVEDTKQRIMGKKYLTFGIIGMICVQILILIAAMNPFGITTGLCVLPPGGVPNPLSPHSSKSDPPNDPNANNPMTGL
jgi:glucan phosphoethanolaminetransferase (alkaline phosphatase superfamily)